MTYENLDLKIINLLLDDGRASLRSLAEELDVSVTTVSNHLQSMEDEGVIKGFKPVLNYDELGYGVTATVMIKAESGSLPGLTEDLKEIDSFLSVYEVTGDFDIIAVGKFKSTEDMNDTIKDLLNNPDIAETNTNVILETIKEDADIEFEV
ncbi:MAG: HTH-type transcriptional regulator Lrp [Halobacteria archaeon]|nr:HTH-type transcriptional regulator Lrp [Halobacteria archaeon]